MAGKEADRATAPLRITLFGPFAVQVDGHPLPRLRSQKEQWLLALLTLRANRPVERDWLAGTLWSESTESQAAYNLRRSLSNLRQALGTQAARLLSPSVHTLQFDLSEASVDVLNFDQAIAQGEPSSLENAVSLYGGALLEGCTEGWAVAERRTREQAYLNALETLAAHAMAHREPAAAVDLLRRVVSVEPLRESAQRALMAALSASGDQAAAILVYRDLRLLLRRELNAEPDPETSALFARIRTTARSQAQPVASAPNVLVTPPSAAFRPLPSPLTSLVGREHEITEISACLHSARLVMLTGSGGVGKTRLAIEVARQMAEDYVDGVGFVELASLSEQGLVAQTVAAVLDVREETDRSLFEVLIDYLHSKQMLLILDNCEHLLKACAEVTEMLLRGCPRLHILATSRQALGLIGEISFRVPSLSLPPNADRMRAQASSETDRLSLLLEYEAPRLFWERARQSLPGFRLTQDNVDAVMDICRQLDGIPLALELAAARVKVIPIEQIAARLQNRFHLLTGGSRTALPRQQTLEALIDWSYELLSEPEQRLLRRLSVCMGGWTLETAEQIGADKEIAAWQVLDLLIDLVEKSLVTYTPETERYSLLETVRAYARKRLQEQGEEAFVRKRHADHFLILAEAAEEQLLGPEQAFRLEQLEAEHENLRAALTWSLDDAQGAKVGLRFVGALWRFWDIRGHLSEGRALSTHVLSRSQAQNRTGERAQALNGAAALAESQGDYETSRRLHEESLAIRRELGDRQGVAASLNNMGNVAFGQGDYETARALFEESLNIDRERGSKEGLPAPLNNLGLVAYYQGDYAAAYTLFEEALTITRELGNRTGEAINLDNLGSVLKAQGDYAAARKLHERSLLLKQELGDKLGIAESLEAFAALAMPQGTTRTPEQTTANDPSAPTQDSLSSLLWSVRLLGAAEALREKIGTPMSPGEREGHHRDTAIVREALGEAAFKAAWAEGQSLSVEQAVAHALEKNSD